MALPQKAIQRLAELAKVKAEDLLAAIKADDEVDVAIDEKIISLTEQEKKTLEKNLYDEGKKAGVEIDVKQAKEKHGLDFQGRTIDGLVEAIQKKVMADAKIEPEKKVQELTEKITNLQNTAKELQTKLQEKESEVANIRTTGELYKYIPDFGDNGPALGRDEVIKLMEANGYSFKMDEGKMVAVKDGKTMVNQLSEALPVKDVVNGFLKEKKLVTEQQLPAGRGGQDTPAGNGKYGSISELKQKFEAEGKSILGEEFSTAVAAAAKDNPDFKME